MIRLNVQDFLIKNKGQFDLLTEYYGIKLNPHPEDERVILNYDQIESCSVKAHPIVRECRGLVLSRNYPYNVIATSFSRFFNKGEHGGDDDVFNWNDFVCQEKVDGSLILLYYWHGSWHVNTRNSFGGGQIGESEYTWRDLVFELLPVPLEELDTACTYILELCSEHNMVVKHYPDPKLYLLTVFQWEKELDFPQVCDIIEFYGFDAPQKYHLNNQDELQHLLEMLQEESATNEGVVLRDCNNVRIKVKTESYLRLHRLNANGNIISDKNLLPIILNGEVDEVLTYWPSLKPYVDNLNERLEKLRSELDNYWYVYGQEPSRKKFALAIQNCRLKALLFKARDLECNPLDLFNQSSELLLKVLQ